MKPHNQFQREKVLVEGGAAQCWGALVSKAELFVVAGTMKSCHGGVCTVTSDSYVKEEIIVSYTCIYGFCSINSLLS